MKDILEFDFSIKLFDLAMTQLSKSYDIDSDKYDSESISEAIAYMEEPGVIVTKAFIIIYGINEERKHQIKMSNFYQPMEKSYPIYGTEHDNWYTFIEAELNMVDDFEDLGIVFKNSEAFFDDVNKNLQYSMDAINQWGMWATRIGFLQIYYQLAVSGVKSLDSSFLVKLRTMHKNGNLIEPKVDKRFFRSFAKEKPKAKPSSSKSTEIESNSFFTLIIILGATLAAVYVARK